MSKFKEVIKYTILLLVFVMISIVFELLIFNHELLFLDDSKKIIEIKDYQEEINDYSKTISFYLENQYVNKLRLIYQSEEKVKFTLNYKEEDYYHNFKNRKIEDSFDNEVEEAVNNIRSKVKYVEILYETDSNLKIDSIIVDNELELNMFRIFFMTMCFILVYVLYRFYKKDGNVYNLHRYFVLVGLLIGVTIIVLQPATTYYSWDDQIHFLNVYEIFDANGKWDVGEVAMIDSEPVGRDSISSIEEQVNMNEYLNIDEAGNYMSFRSRFIPYNKIAYLPSAIGFHLCKIIKLPFVVCFKVGKFMNLLAYLLIFGYAIKIATSFKRFLVVLGLIPTNLFLATQYSYDPAVVSGLTLGIILLYNVITNKESKVDFKFMILFIGSMLYGCFPKAVYAPFILLFLLIPKDKFKSKKLCNYAKVGIIIITILMMATFVLPTVSSTTAGDPRGGATSVTDQLKLILTNPIGYIKVLKDTMIDEFFNNFIGKKAIINFSYMKEPSDNLYYIYLLLIIIVGIVENFKDENFKKFSRLFSFVLLMGVVVLIWTALYLSFTPVGLTTINGVQARYFLPLLLPLFLCIKPKNMYLKDFSKKYDLFVLLVPIVVLLLVIFSSILVPYCF
ncbi:MAG: DUF2142 domain-containing protein [Candidatus Aphodocola sp.]